jgi:hypothetical protein
MGLAGFTVTVTDIGAADVAGLTQPIRAFPVPAAAGWTGPANLIYDNYAEGLQFSAGWLYSQFNWEALPYQNSDISIHGVTYTGAYHACPTDIAIDDTLALFTNEEGDDTDAPEGTPPPDKRWPYHIPRPGRYCGQDFTALHFDLADNTGYKFGVFMPAHSNTWSSDDTKSYDDHNYVLQDAYVNVFVLGVGQTWADVECEPMVHLVNADESGTYCPFLMIESDEPIDAVTIIHDSSWDNSPTWGMMDVYSDVPEPMTLGLVVMGAAGLLLRKRR